MRGIDSWGWAFAGNCSLAPRKRLSAAAVALACSCLQRRRRCSWKMRSGTGYSSDCTTSTKATTADGDFLTCDLGLVGAWMPADH